MTKCLCQTTMHHNIKKKKIEGHENFRQLTLTAELIGVMMEITKEIKKGSLMIINDLTKSSGTKSRFSSNKTIQFFHPDIARKI